MATSSALPSETTPSSSETPVGPGTDEVPIDPTLSNPDPSSTSDDKDTGEPVSDPDPNPTTTSDPGEDPPPVTPAPCTDGVTDGSNSVCYFVSTAPVVWNDARLACDAWGGTLAEIDTPEEDAFVGTLLDADMWIGASDTVTDNTYLWIDLRPVTFGNWGPGQPDRFPGADCVEKRQEPGEPWYDQPCNDLHPFVCERPLTP
jgi:hypothetical protein